MIGLIRQSWLFYIKIKLTDASANNMACFEAMLRFCAPRKCGGAISVMERSCAVPITKVKRHISDRFCAIFWFSENTSSARRGGKWVGERAGNHGDVNRELKQQRRRRLRRRKRHLKSELALPQTLSRLFHLIQFVKCCQFVFGVEF